MDLTDGEFSALGFSISYLIGFFQIIMFNFLSVYL